MVFQGELVILLNWEMNFTECATFEQTRKGDSSGKRVPSPEHMQGCPTFWRLWATLEEEEELSWASRNIHWDM